MYRIGIIGCGKIAQVRHIPEYIANGKTEIVAYYDINHERAKSLADKFGGMAYDSIDALLSSDLDAVSICTANSTHAKIAIDALKSGKNVLCEKPMAITLEECIEMDAVAQETKKILMIGQNQRLAKAHVKAHELIKNGEIGKVISFRTTFGHQGPETWSVDRERTLGFLIRARLAWAQWPILGYIRQI